MNELTIRRIDEDAPESPDYIGYIDASTVPGTAPAAPGTTTFTSFPPVTGSGDVEFDIVQPDGSRQTVDSRGLPAGELVDDDPEALAKAQEYRRVLAYALQRLQKRRGLREEAKATRTAKSRKKRNLQKVSRKKNR